MGSATHGLVVMGPVRAQAGEHSQKRQDTGTPKVLKVSKFVCYEERRNQKLEDGEEQPDVEVVAATGGHGDVWAVLQMWVHGLHCSLKPC